jgi:predicted alpha/beta superfamily hydrolase
MGILNWEAPPPSSGGRKADRHWAEIAEELRGRPGEWALVSDDISHQAAHNIRAGRLASFRPAGSFEATMRDIHQPTGRGRMYVRFVGEQVAR